MFYPVTKLETAPAQEPITLPQARTQCSIGTDTSWDTYLSAIIPAARARAEHETGRRLITQTWSAYYPAFCGRAIILPFGRLQAVTAFEWTDIAGTVRSLTVSGGNLLNGSTTVAHIDIMSDPGRIVLASAQSWPTETLRTSNPIKITFACGYGDDPEDVDPTILAAMKLDIGFLFRFRESVVASDIQSVESKELPMGYESLLTHHKLYLV